MNLQDAIVGAKVTYHPLFGPDQKGIIKSTGNETTVFVVYHCNDDWDNYIAYMGQGTLLNELLVGWQDETAPTDAKGVIKRILETNYNAALTGSHALLLQGYKINSELKDIDIYTGHYPFNVLSGMERVYTVGVGDASPGSEQFPRESYTWHGYKIDVFKSTKEYFDALHENMECIDFTRCVHWADILKFKLTYLYEGSSTKEKHLKNLVYFLENNFK